MGKKVIKEVGGIKQHYIDETADLNATAIQVLCTKIITNCQRCTSIQEALIHEKVYDAFVQELLPLARNVVMDNPFYERVWEADNVPDQFGFSPSVSAKTEIASRKSIRRRT